MRPEDRQITPIDPRGQIQAPSRGNSANQTAAANIARSQLDSIYSGEPEQQPAPAAESSDLPATYRRTHGDQHAVQAEEWKQYHSAWQDYYQKYYEHYYVGAVKQVHQAYTNQSATQPQAQDSPRAVQSDDISQDEAINDLRSQLLGKVKNTGKKMRGSRHFVPIAAALIVLVLFSFMQYNRAIIANVKAYVTPGEIDPQNIVVDPNASTQVGPEPMLIIPKINVNVPVEYNVAPDQASQLKAMENGVAYFGIPGANSKPGQVGNTVISGHSSNDFIDSGSYKFVFALLERLSPGDIFYLHYEGTRYTYSITKTRVVRPTEVTSLVYETTKPEVTLITCTPLGTALNRLLVTAEQVSPNPAGAAAAPAVTQQTGSTPIPGNSPTVLERLFGS
ncbi:sortase [Candidatus Saccharibacteria bacterium]|nr:sortase [Candidatus Saccharibacteria bacterium]